ncbi:MAG: hypothetical protein ACYSU0_21560 [Planctomycetota bacterium]|jgi:hypothetical protein
MRQVGERVYVLREDDGAPPYWVTDALVVSAGSDTVCICTPTSRGKLFFLTHDQVFTTHEEAAAARNDWSKIGLRDTEL